jgi:hypothetical protein
LSFNLILHTVVGEIDNPNIVIKNSDIFLSVRFNAIDNIDIIRKISKEYLKYGRELGTLNLNSLLYLGQ